MENNFFVGNIFHRRRFKFSYIEKAVLFTDDCEYYLDLVSGKWYTIDTKSKDYVIKDSLIQTNITEHKIDYLYLLNKNKQKTKIKKKSTNK